MSHVHKSMGTLYGAPVWDVSGCPEPHEWDDRTEIEKAADALADAVEALNLETDDGRAFGDPPRVDMAPSKATIDAIRAALAAYREAQKSPGD